MKTKTYSILFFAVSYILLFNACKRDAPCPSATPSIEHKYYLQDSSKKKIPYTGFDTLVFISDSGEIATLYGHGKQDTLQVYARNTQPGLDCDYHYDYWEFEIIQFTFTGNNPDLNSINYSVTTSDGTNPIPYIDGVAYGISINQKSNWYDSFYFNFIIDTITIKGINYLGRNIPIDNNLTLYFFYNSKYGIMKISNINGKTWTLKL